MNVSGLSMEELAGQRLMLGFDGLFLNSELKHLVREYRAGGIILFKSNIESVDQLKKLCFDAGQYALDCGLPPLFIAMDQEGGVVARLGKPFTQFPGNPHVKTLEAAREFARITARELLDVGVNMNMAPVMDVAPRGVDSIMKQRVFPGDHDLVSKLGTAMIQTFQDQNLMAVAKHFPGIGRTVKDSHFSLPVLDAEIQMLWASDIKPFKAARDVKVAGIMLSHIFYPQLDPVWQASLSPLIAGELLRNELGYDGLVMTDDLDMKAIDHDIKTCMRQIMSAEIDLALICHSGPNIQKARDAVLGILETNSDLFKKGNASVQRILRAKEKFLSD
ncbi:MAG: glycoside hydrolase family 3 protein [Desulfobacter sp.]|nr:glycoside hydrolase family 3 protein [Desulfobacter sp.]